MQTDCELMGSCLEQQRNTLDYKSLCPKSIYKPKPHTLKLQTKSGKTENVPASIEMKSSSLAI